jgi:nucleoside-diphosphate-sugar epimerase
VITAAKATPSIKNLIYSSASGTGTHESFPKWGPDHPMYGYWLAKNEIENLVRDAGFPNWTIVQLGIFLQLFVPPISNWMFPDLWGSADGKRVLRTAFGAETRLDVVDGGNIGAVVAAALQKPEDFKYRMVKLATESVTIDELAEKIERARSERVEVVHYSAADLAKKLGPMGPRLVAAQELFNYIGSSIDAQKNREEFNMKSVEEFFAGADI